MALHAYARSGNGWEVGPGTVLGVAALLAGIFGGGVCVALRKRPVVARSVLLFSATGMATLIVLSWIRPPARPNQPIPITGVTKEADTVGV
jgi:hypothetical protein